jgi:cobalt-precorrin-5B (C1)-methyltransferase
MLRCGFTTGSCAAGAAKAAVTGLLTGTIPKTVTITLPDSSRLELPITQATTTGHQISCAVRKNAGDDPDATDGALVFATARLRRTGAEIDGGQGVGRVTKPGLDQPVGAAAINSVPRAMIQQAVGEAAAEAGYLGGWQVVISCPAGVEIAHKTFNPRLGIEGGISILGTSGIVHPMSTAALQETTAREVSVLAHTGVSGLLIVIGNYGEAFTAQTLGLHSDNRRFGMVKSANFIGAAIEQCASQGIGQVFVVGHLGKFAKIAIGMLNTHSSVGDGRIEALIAAGLAAGVPAEVLLRVQGATSTDAALGELADAGFEAAALHVLSQRIQQTFDRFGAVLRLEWLCFAGAPGSFHSVARSQGADDLIREWS